MQVLLRWGLQAGCTVIPKSVQPERIEEYTESCLLSWELSVGSFEQLSSLPEEPKLCWDPSGIL